MFDRDKWREVFQVLGKNIFRTTATAFGVFWGIFMLIIMLGAGTGLKNGILADFNIVTNSMFLWSQPTSMPFAGFKKGRSFELRNDDVPYLRKEVPEIEIISPRLQMGGHRGSNVAMRGIKSGSFNIYGDTPDFFKIEEKPLTRGRLLNWNDLKHQKKVCVIGQRVFDLLFQEDEDPIGDIIKINGINWTVVGVYKSLLSGEQADGDLNSIFIPLTSFQRAFNMGDIIGWFSITSINDVPVSTVEEKVKEALKVKYKVHPDDDRAFGSFNVEEEYNEMNNIFLGIQWLSWFVGILTLFAGVIGVSNIMLVIIKERTNEIGVRRALGASPLNIIGQIILESVFLTCIAGFVGIICGVWALEGISHLIASSGGESGSFRDPRVAFDIVIIAFGVLVICGALAGVLPGYRAVKIKPVDALRYE